MFETTTTTTTMTPTTKVLLTMGALAVLVPTLLVGSCGVLGSGGALTGFSVLAGLATLLLVGVLVPALALFVVVIS